MTDVEQLAAFVDRAQLGDLSEQALEQLKIRVLDTIGVAIGALTAGPIVAIGALTAQPGGRPLTTLMGGGKTAPDRAAFFNGALSRYLDLMELHRGKTAILPTILAPAQHSREDLMPERSADLPASLKAALDYEASPSWRSISIVAATLAQYLERPIHTVFRSQPSGPLVAGTVAQVRLSCR